MAKKQKKPEIKRSPTKRQMAKWQRQKRTQRIIMIVAGVFFTFIAGYIGYGYYSDQVGPFNKPVLKVNDTVFDMGYYVEVLEIYSQGQDSSSIPYMADMVVGAIEQNELIRQGAAGLGISVSKEEIEEQLKSLNLSDTKVYRDAVEVSLLAEILMENYIGPEVPTSGEQVKVQAMVLEDKMVAEDVIREFEISDNFTALVEGFSVEEATRELGGDLGWFPRGTVGVLYPELDGTLLEDIAFELEPRMLSEPTYDESVLKRIGYWLIKVIERDDANGSHINGILLGNLQEAEEIRSRIEDGEDFALLAQEYSQHVASRDIGGDMGWVQEGSGNQIVSVNAFDLEIGVLSDPIRDDSIRTQGGCWLVRVLDKDDDRQIEDDTREILKSKAFEDWLLEQRENSSIERYLDDEQKSWAVERVLAGRE